MTATPPNSHAFEKKPSWKTDFVRERQLNR
ncbi:hypothetical protein BMS3Abin13_01569 [bacterium BMS3Abin13]|nr:hypothetical protein BMS3Abin13_01569 [bacterium BMS3Abin13]